MNVLVILHNNEVYQYSKHCASQKHDYSYCEKIGFEKHNTKKTPTVN